MFSLVRQFPNEDEEFYQVHVKVLYKPDNENIFSYIRNSKVFEYAKNKNTVE